MAYWLCKTEPGTYSIADLKRDGTTLWDSIRNYQARNYLKEMKVGELVLIYHSSVIPPGVAGIAKVSKTAAPDPLQFNPKSKYFDPGSTRETPRWVAPEFTFVKEFPHIITLGELRSAQALKGLQLLKQGNRLSVMPLTKSEYEGILRL